MEKKRNSIVSVDLRVMSRRIEIWSAIVWPLLLVLTWCSLLLLAVNFGVFREIPAELREGISRTDPKAVPGFLQDPFYTIWQFFWIPLVFTIIYAFRKVPYTINYFLSLSKKDPEAVRIPEAFDHLLQWFKNKLGSYWQWILAAVGGSAAMLMQINTQLSRFRSMDIMYWWDWRISKTIFMIRLIMVGVDIFFAIFILYRSVWCIVFIRRFLNLVKLKPRPLHPDKAGGFAIIGRLCFSFTTPLLVIGMVIATSYLFHEEATYFILNTSALLLYILSAIFVFFFPLSSVHKTMKAAKEEWLDRISLQIHRTLIKIDKIPGNDYREFEDEFAKADCLQNYYDTIHSMPIWPYDFRTISKFFTSIMIPTLVFLVQIVIEMIFKTG